LRGRTLHFIHLSDSHVRSAEGRDADLGRLGGVVERIGALHADGVPIDFVVHGGDLADAADAPGASAEATADALTVLERLPLRWFLLNGNHDRRAFLEANAPRRGGLGEVPCVDTAGVAVREIGGVRLVFVDANPERGGAEDVAGVISAATVAGITRCLDAWEGRAALFLHYPPLPQEALWPASPTGGEALHEALAARAAGLHGVFVGHNHRSTHHLRDGVLYVTAPALSRQFLLWPGQAVHALDEAPLAGLHYVTLEADGTTRVQHHAWRERAI